MTERLPFLICDAGAAHIRPLPSGKVASIETRDAWDGEDAPEEDEEFSLEDIMGDDF